MIGHAMATGNTSSSKIVHEFLRREIRNAIRLNEFRRPTKRK